jgi:hypothetical protein
MAIVVGILVFGLGVAALWLAKSRPAELTDRRVGIGSSLVNALPERASRIIWALFGVGLCALGVVIVVTG